MNYSDTRTDQRTEADKVLGDTYKLLGLTLLFASFASYLSVVFAVPQIHWLIVFGVHLLLLYLIEKNNENMFGLVLTFAWTGWLGLSTGPAISYYLTIPNGSDIIIQSLLGTSIIFVGLSGWVLYKKTDLHKWSSFLSITLLSAFIMGVLNMLVFQSGIFSTIISTVFMFLSGAVIMWQTSEIIHGGERNYIRATTTLFVSIYNIFMSLLNILGNNR